MPAHGQSWVLADRSRPVGFEGEQEAGRVGGIAWNERGPGRPARPGRSAEDTPGHRPARSAARAAGQAVATAHVPTHSLGAADYAVQAICRATDASRAGARMAEETEIAPAAGPSRPRFDSPRRPRDVVHMHASAHRRGAGICRPTGGLPVNHHSQRSPGFVRWR
jgi:hypothetical protein